MPEIHDKPGLQSLTRNCQLP